MIEEREALRRVALHARKVCRYAMATVDPADITAKSVIRDLFNALEDLERLDRKAADGAVAALTQPSPSEPASSPAADPSPCLGTDNAARGPVPPGRDRA